MNKSAYYRSKIPIFLMLLFLANIFLVIAFELMFVYKYPSAIDETVLGKYNPAWAGSTILSQDSYSTSLDVCLAELPDGNRILITTKSHGIAFGRAKLADVQEVKPGEAEQVFHIKNGVHTSEVLVSNGNTATLTWGYGGTMSEITTVYMFLGGTLTGLELLLFHILKKND